MAEKDEGAGGKEGKTRERRAAGREPGFCGDDLGGRGRGFPLRITATAAGAATTTTAAGESSVPGPYDPIIPYPSHPGDWSPPNLPVRLLVRARGQSSVPGGAYWTEPLAPVIGGAGPQRLGEGARGSGQSAE